MSKSEMQNKKIDDLRSVLRGMKRVLLAYSGGVDSTFLLKILKEEIDQDVLAITACSETYPVSEIKEAETIAEDIGAAHILINTDELSNPRFSSNPENRCYFCKKELFERLKEIADISGIEWIIDGSNLDDDSDHRPGRIAAEELGVRSPLKEVGLTKDEIRKASKAKKLPTWNKPAYACLASRFPYGTELTKENLSRIETAEQAMKKLGFNQIRIRHHQDIVRIEINQDDISRFLDTGIRSKIIDELRGLGYPYITLDLDGYRSGSMNETLDNSNQ